MATRPRNETPSRADLGGVIFGANDATFAECVNGMLFGKESIFHLSIPNTSGLIANLRIVESSK